MLHTIGLDNSFDMVFIDFREPGNIPDQDGYRSIRTFLDCMTGFGLVSSSALKKMT